MRPHFISLTATALTKWLNIPIDNTVDGVNKMRKNKTSGCRDSHLRTILEKYEDKNLARHAI